MDLIDRRVALDAAIEAADDWDGGCSKERERFIRYALEELPPAQPGLDEWCTDCKEYDQEKHCCPRWNRVIREALKDVQPEQLRHETTAR